MNGPALLETALVLGLYVFLGGSWGLLYTLGRLWRAPALRRAGTAAYAVQVVIAAAVVLLAPLAPDWKGLIVASTIAFRVIPPVVWRFLQHTHEDWNSEHDRKPGEHPGRAVAGL